MSHHSLEETLLSSHNHENLDIPINETGLIESQADTASEMSFKTIIKTLILSTIPVALTNIILFLNQTITLHFLKSEGDIKMLGAFGLAGTLISIVSLAIVMSLNVGLTSRIAQAFGAKNYRLVGLTFHRGLIINLVIYLPCSCLFYWSDKICILLNFDADTSSYIQQFLSFSIPGMFALMLFSTITAYLNACQIFAVPGAIQIITSILYWLISYWLIEEKGMAIRGAAISWNILYFTQLIILFTYIRLRNPVPHTFFWFFSKSFKGLWTLFKYELWVGSMIYLEWIAYEVIFLFAGSLNSAEFTALTVVNTNIGLVYSIPFALGDTVLTFTGNAVGEKNAKKAKRYLKAGVICSVGAMLLVELCYLFFSNYVIKFYVDDEDTTKEAEVYFKAYLLQMPPDFIQIVLASGLRSLGKEKVGTILMVLCYYVVAVPLSCVFCYVTKLGGLGLILGPATGVYILLIGLLCLYLKLDWEKQTKVVNEEHDQDKLKEEGCDNDLENNKDECPQEVDNTNVETRISL